MPSKAFYDLHIHSCLSPCGDDDMTPNNIVNMAAIKGLNAIAITDHNSTLQLPSIMELSSSYNMLVIPGVEVSTKEGYHVVCLFKSLNDANAFQSVLENFLKVPLYIYSCTNPPQNGFDGYILPKLYILLNSLFNDIEL